MTKIQYRDFNKKELIHCESCESDFDISYFNYSRVKPTTNTADRCKLCDWFFRHKNLVINSLYDINTIRTVVDFFINKRGEYIHDLAKILGINEDDTYTIVKYLSLTNQPLKAVSICETCGKKFETSYSAKKNSKYQYYSQKCYYIGRCEKTKCNEYKTTTNRIITRCTNCGKEISVIPYDFNKKNSFGDNHNFCTQQCYWAYRKVYYHDEKCWMYGRYRTDEQKEKQRVIATKMKSQQTNLDTKIQVAVNSILDYLCVEYKREKSYIYYSVDNYLPEYNLIVEVMGDYWHVNPLVYDGVNAINQTQCSDINRDKSKKTFIKKYYNIDILYLWETDINKNPQLCQLLIEHYIKNHGNISNYHSFNYHIENGDLCINTDILLPYFETDEIYNNIKI